MTHPTDALRLVPVEPTAKMAQAARDAIHAAQVQGYAGLDPIDIYRAMLAAAPASPLPGGGWQDISTAPKEEGVKVMAFDGTKVGEAVLYGEWEESNDFEDAVLRWRWANDSCSCCWGKAEPQPTHWQPLPAAPTGEPK